MFTNTCTYTYIVERRSHPATKRLCWGGKRTSVTETQAGVVSEVVTELTSIFFFLTASQKSTMELSVTPLPSSADWQE